MLDNTNMGGGDGRPKYLHILQLELEKVIILIAFFCKVALLCNITARRVEKLCCAFYHSHVQTAVLQQFRLLQVARILTFDWLSRGGSRIFVRRGCTRLLLYFNSNKPHSFFLQNTSCIDLFTDKAAILN